MTARSSHAGTLACSFVSCLVVALLAAPCGAQCRYEVTILPEPGGTVDAYGVNDSGSVAGVWIHFPTHDAFVWPGEGPLVLLPMPSGDRSIANDINASGFVVGVFSSESGDRGFVWDGQETRTLGFLPGHSVSEALAINDDGVVVGFSQSLRRPVAWIDEKIQDLSPPLGAERGQANDINERDEVVGEYRPPDGPVDRAFFLEMNTGKAIDIGLIPGGEDGDARAVNNRGHVVVTGTDLKTGERRTFLWKSGQMIDLGLLPGDTGLAGTDLNDRGLIVGASRGEDRIPVAFVWHQGRLFDLNDLISAEGLALRSALAINNAGVIVCKARRDNSDIVAVRLTPIDVPAGDVTGDCRVDISDLLTLLSQWGPCTYCIADLDGNGTVDFQDLLILLASWD